MRIFAKFFHILPVREFPEGEYGMEKFAIGLVIGGIGGALLAANNYKMRTLIKKGQEEMQTKLDKLMDEKIEQMEEGVENLKEKAEETVENVKSKMNGTEKAQA